MTYQAIVYDVRNHIGYVTLNRPQVLNAVNQQMRREIIDVCERMRADSEVRACIFTGAGERAEPADESSLDVLGSLVPPID